MPRPNLTAPTTPPVNPTTLLDPPASAAAPATPTPIPTAPITLQTDPNTGPATLAEPTKTLTSSPTMMFAVGLLILIAIAISQWSRHAKRRRDDHPMLTARDQLEELRRQADLASGGDAALAQAQQAVRRLGMQVDAKAIRLERLIAEADARIARLEDAERRLESLLPPEAAERRAAEALATAAARTHTRPATGLTGPFALVGFPPDDPNAPRLSAPPAARPADPAPRPSHPTPRAEPAIDPMHRQIADLADQGLTPVEIAQRLSQPVGQVQLVLNLRRA